MAIETLRPTDAYNPGGWSTPSNIWDGNTGTGASVTNPNETPSISVGGAAGGEATNSWDAQAETWTAATLNVNFGKTAGSNDTVNVVYGKYEGGSYTKIADLVPSTSGGITQQTFQATLTEADFGSGSRNKLTWVLNDRNRHSDCRGHTLISSQNDVWWVSIVSYHPVHSPFGPAAKKLLTGFQVRWSFGDTVVRDTRG